MFILGEKKLLVRFGIVGGGRTSALVTSIVSRPCETTPDRFLAKGCSVRPGLRLLRRLLRKNLNMDEETRSIRITRPCSLGSSAGTASEAVDICYPRTSSTLRSGKAALEAGLHVICEESRCSLRG